MSSYQRNIQIGAATVVTLFVGLFFYVGRVGPQMNLESQRALNTFFDRARTRDYTRAHALISRDLAADLTPAKVAARWTKFESNHGAIRNWGPTTGGQRNIGRVCVFPPFVDFYHHVRGERGGSVFYTRLKPENGGWRVDRWSELSISTPRPTAVPETR